MVDLPSDLRLDETTVPVLNSSHIRRAAADGFADVILSDRNWATLANILKLPNNSFAPIVRPMRASVNEMRRPSDHLTPEAPPNTPEPRYHNEISDR
jgi:hypothetical protein